MERRTGARSKTGRYASGSRAGEAKAAQIAKDERTGEAAVRRGPRPDLCRQYARKRFAEALPGIVDRFAEDARGGDVAALRALIGLSGLDREEAHQQRQRRGPSLAKLLMGELKKTRAKVEARQAAEREAAAASANATDGAVTDEGGEQAPGV